MKSGSRILPAAGKPGPPAWPGSAQLHNCLQDFVKHALLQQLVPPGATVCDLYSGHGADTPKWAQAQIGRYVGVDLTTSALEEAREHWDALNRPYLADFCELDPCMEDLQGHLHHMGLPADIVCCMGHLQDCFLSEDVVRRLLQNVSSILKPGGYFFGITADSSTIWSKYQKAVEGALKAGSLRANGLLPRVNSDYYVIIFEDDRFMTFGTKYTLQLPDGLPSQSQILVHFPSLIRLAEDVGLEYIEIQNLLDFYEDYRILFVDALQRTCGNMLDSKGRLPNFALDILSLYSTFIFKKEEHMEPESVTFLPLVEDEYQSCQWAGNMDMIDEPITVKSVEDSIVTPSQSNEHPISWVQQSVGHGPEEFDVFKSDYHPKAQTPNISIMTQRPVQNIQNKEQGCDVLELTMERTQIDYKQAKEENNFMDYEPCPKLDEQTEEKLLYVQVQNVYKRKRSVHSSRSSTQFFNPSSTQEDCEVQRSQNDFTSERIRREQILHSSDSQIRQSEIPEGLDSNMAINMVNQDLGYSRCEEPQTSEKISLPQVFNEKCEGILASEHISLQVSSEKHEATDISEQKPLPKIFSEKREGSETIHLSLNYNKIQLLEDPQMLENVSLSEVGNEKQDDDQNLASPDSQIHTLMFDKKEEQQWVMYKDGVKKKDSDQTDSLSMDQANYPDPSAPKGLANKEIEQRQHCHSSMNDCLINVQLPTIPTECKCDENFVNLPVVQHESPDCKSLLVGLGCSKQQPSNMSKDIFGDQMSHSNELSQSTEQEHEHHCAVTPENPAPYLLVQRQEDSQSADLYPCRNMDLQSREEKQIMNKAHASTSIDPLGVSSEAVYSQEEIYGLHHQANL